MRIPKLKPLYLCLAITGLLVACDKDKPVDQAATMPAAPQAEPRIATPTKRPAPVPAPEGEKGADLLAEAGVALDFPHAIAYDIMDVSRAGTPRHRVLVEVLGGDLATAKQRLGQTLTGLGYAKKADTDKGGRVEQIYTMGGKPAYYLLIQPAGMGPKLVGKDAVGSIHVMWNIP